VLPGDVDAFSAAAGDEAFVFEYGDGGADGCLGHVVVGGEVDDRGDSPGELPVGDLVAEDGGELLVVGDGDVAVDRHAISVARSAGFIHAHVSRLYVKQQKSQFSGARACRAPQRLFRPDEYAAARDGEDQALTGEQPDGSLDCAEG
jgi:hypothetical protein